MAAPAAVLRILVTANGAQAIGSLRTVDAQLGKTATASEKMHRAVATAAKGAAIGVGVVGVASVKLATDFDKSMRNVNSIAQLPEKQLKSLEGQVLSLAGKTAQAPKTLAEGLYDIVSSGFNAKQGMKILAASAKAATAGLTDTATSTKAVVAVLNAYHKPAKDAGKVSDTLFETVNRGVITFDELSNVIGDVLPFASQLHVGLNQVGAAMSTMTKQGLSGAESSTRLKNTLVAFIKPSNDMAKAIEKTGFSSGEALVKAKGFQGALEAVKGTTDGSKEAMAKLFPNIRALGGALSLTGSNAKTAHQDLDAFKNSSGATNLALSQQSKSLSYQWQKVKASVDAVLIQLGTALIPALKSVVGGVQGVIDRFNQLRKKGESVPDALAQALGEAAGKLANKAAQIAPKAAAAFVNAWLHAGIWAQLFTIALLSKRLGLFGVLGQMAANRFANKFGSQASDALPGAINTKGIRSIFLSWGGIMGGVAAAAITQKIASALAKGKTDLPGNIQLPGQGGNLPKLIHGIGNLFHARGGMIPGSGSGDTVPAMLEPGEFVMRKAVVDKFGPTFFAGLNGMKSGGMVGAHKSSAVSYGPGPHLSYQGLVNLWLKNGGPRSYALLMGHVAQAESNGYDVVNEIGAGGYWQIYPPVAGYLNPNTNARLAIQKLATQGLGAWVSSEAGWGKYRYLIGRDPGGGSKKLSKKAKPHKKATPVAGKLVGSGGSSGLGGFGGSVYDRFFKLGSQAAANGQPALSSAQLGKGIALSPTAYAAYQAGYQSYVAANPPAASGDSGPSLADLIAQQIQTMQELRDEAKRANDFAQSVSQTQYGALQRELTQIVNGGIGGKVGLGFAMPSRPGRVGSR